MQITGDWLTSTDTQTVLRMLNDAGHEAYCVGGCVRNALLNTPVADVDIATNAHPEQVIALAKAADLKSIPTGIDHGTITVISGDEAFEITTYRNDVSTDGRRATVAFSTDIKDDAKRRDFTINALYVSVDGTLLDPLNGLPDIDAPHIRFIENADRRIKEDYLRILRFFRFYAWYGNPAEGLDKDGLAACADNIDGIAQLSKERVGSEMQKLLAAPNPAPAVATMSASGVLAQTLSGADPQFLSPLVHIEETSSIPPSWKRRLAILGGVNRAKSLRLSHKSRTYLRKLKAAMQSGQPAKTMAYQYGADIALDAKLIEAATLATPLAANLQDQISQGATAIFPLRGADLLDHIPAGPELGAELARLENLWIASDFTLTKAALLNS